MARNRKPVATQPPTPPPAKPKTPTRPPLWQLGLGVLGLIIACGVAANLVRGPAANRTPTAGAATTNTAAAATSTSAPLATHTAAGPTNSPPPPTDTAVPPTATVDARATQQAEQASADATRQVQVGATRTAVITVCEIAPELLDEADLNCSDFTTQRQATCLVQAYPGDPYGLDADGDGQACVSLP